MSAAVTDKILFFKAKYFQAPQTKSSCKKTENCSAQGSNLIITLCEVQFKVYEIPEVVQYKQFVCKFEKSIRDNFSVNRTKKKKGKAEAHKSSAMSGLNYSLRVGSFYRFNSKKASKQAPFSQRCLNTT